ncbi:hypothetical protein [Shinella zoogloeoides]|uniref:hypothetical protein n=1 Tax=Shinella zoogloeoides TaxID=352475 RepID=UPI0028AD73C3|nr:hypothetical protein [Shinella zoogloeoides]
MSPEWMIALDRMERMARRRRKDPFSDPLEREEWAGLEWAIRLFGWLGNDRRKPAPAPFVEPVLHRTFFKNTAWRRL